MTHEDEGTCQVVVSNAYGNVTSHEAALKVAMVTVDPEFQGAAGGHQVEALAMQPDGKIVVGGYFQYLEGCQVSGLGRLNPDGTLDPSFTAATDFGDWVLTVAVQPDGKILSGGRFSVMGDHSLIRLHPDGTPDEDFAGRANKWVYCVATQPDGKILIGGNFTEVNGQACPPLARLNADGTLDSSFVPASILQKGQPAIHTIAVQSDGKILLGGEFYTRSAPTWWNCLERLHPDGSMDEDFETTVDNYHGRAAGRQNPDWRSVYHRQWPAAGADRPAEPGRVAGYGFSGFR